jgi:3'-5' exoribonuclease
MKIIFSEMTVGATVAGKVFLAGASIRKTKGTPPTNYLNAELSDGNETIEGKIWKFTAPEVPEIGKVYDIVGAAGEFAGKKQITIQTLRRSDDQSLIDFSCVYSNDIDNMWAAVTQKIQSISNKLLRDITSVIYLSNINKIKYSSSAKAVHHVGIGGNLAHTLEVCRYAECIVDFSSILASRDLVIAGALLHDIGKIEVYEVNGPSVEYTLTGHLEEHLVVGIRMVDEAVKILGTDYTEAGRLLRHIIASHHGQLEYGSPVTPKIAEAYIVNMADGISATLDTLDAANVKALRENKTMTDKIYTLGNREHILQINVARALVCDLEDCDEAQEEAATQE